MPNVFIPNPNFERELTAESGYVQLLTVAAQAVVNAAKALAPVESGAYRDGLKVIIQGRKVYASATDWKGGFIEWGTVHNSPYAPLRRGVRVAGLKFQEQKR